MANKNSKHSKNISGKWYCTSSDDENGEGCMSCGVCIGGAPEIFGEDENGEAYVIKQPENAEEKALAQEQLDCCPANAIGNDG